MLPDWIELCTLLNAHGVEYLLVGGQAVIAHGREPVRVDILTDIPGVTFAEAWASRISITLDEVPLHVIGKAELIRNKRAVGRLQDLADADELEKLGT